MFDPEFSLSLKMDAGKIVEAELHNCINQTLFGTTEVDSEGMLHGFGLVEKSPESLRDMFSGFMHNMTELGPYLTDPKKVTQYDKTLGD